MSAADSSMGALRADPRRGWQRFLDPARLVFLDGRAPAAIDGAATNMTRRYGRCAVARRLVAAVPHGHWRTTTCIAGLRQSEVVAPLVLDGRPRGVRGPHSPAR